MLRFPCPVCGGVIDIEHDRAETLVECPQCQRRVKAPAAELCLVSLTCPHCRNVVEVEGSLVGTTGECPHCRRFIQIPKK